MAVQSIKETAAKANRALSICLLFALFGQSISVIQRIYIAMTLSGAPLFSTPNSKAWLIYLKPSKQLVVGFGFHPRW